MYNRTLLGRVEMMQCVCNKTPPIRAINARPSCSMTIGTCVLHLIKCVPFGHQWRHYGYRMIETSCDHKQYDHVFVDQIDTSDESVVPTWTLELVVPLGCPTCDKVSSRLGFLVGEGYLCTVAVLLGRPLVRFR